tara:strand:- start:96 stop:1109 length:1014 start_codon:yes stop_codon:yes gene_type:complete
MNFLILFLFIFFNIPIMAIVMKDYEYLNNNSWVLNSYFNYKEPNDSILNIAYPSAIAYYFITIIPPSSKYLFTGKFLEKQMYESSLTVYNQDGSLNNNFTSINTFNTLNVNYSVDNNSSDFSFVFQRFYGNMDYYSKEDLIENLFQVINLNNNYVLTPLNSLKRDIISNTFYQPLEKIFSNLSPSKKISFTKFYLPKQSVNGLFPDKNHYYLISLINNNKVLKITGYFKPSKLTPYMDFITVNQDLIKTDNGLPFYQLSENYELYVVDPFLTDYEIEELNINSSKVIKWDKNNTNPAIIFRLIDYSNKGITQIPGPLTPTQTENEMKYGFYPEIEII